MRILQLCLELVPRYDSLCRRCIRGCSLAHGRSNQCVIDVARSVGRASDDVRRDLYEAGSAGGFDVPRIKKMQMDSHETNCFFIQAIYVTWSVPSLHSYFDV